MAWSGTGSRVRAPRIRNQQQIKRYTTERCECMNELTVK